MSSLVEWMEALEGSRSEVVESLEIGLDQGWASSPGSTSSPELSSSPALLDVVSSPQSYTGYASSGSSRVDYPPTPQGESQTRSQVDSMNEFIHEGALGMPLADFMEEDDILSQYLANDTRMSEAAPIDAVPPELFTDGDYEPLYLPLPSCTKKPLSLQESLQTPARLTDADVEWLTNSRGSGAAVDPMHVMPQSQSFMNSFAANSTSEQKPKAIKDLRVEFYRQEIRKQTNGKHSAGKFKVGDVESRSPFFLSFIWREYVNKKYNIRIPPFVNPTNGQVDSKQLLQQKIRNSRTPWKQVDLDKALKEAQASSNQPRQIGRYRGDIAYYFRRCLWEIPSEDVEELKSIVPRCKSLVELEDGRLAYMEAFQPGDIVAVLADGSVTKDTTREDVALISIVPGNDRSLIAPWKCLPEPAPQPIEEHVLVAVMGIVQIRVTGTVPERADEAYVIVPSGRGDGSGVVLPQSKWLAAPAVQPIVALPLSGKEEFQEGLLLAFRSEQVNTPWLQRLENKTRRLENTQQEHTDQIEAISTAVDGLQLTSQLSPNDTRERLELQMRPRLAAHHTQLAKAGHAPCKCLEKVLAKLAENNQSLPDALNERGQNIVTLPGHPYSPQYALTKETGERTILENLLVVPIGKAFLAVQPVVGLLEGDSVDKDAIGVTESDVERLRKGDYTVRINQECSGCEIMLDKRFVLRLVKVKRWRDSIEDIIAEPLSGIVTKDAFMPSARLYLRAARGKRRKYIGRGRMAKKLAKGLGHAITAPERHHLGIRDHLRSSSDRKSTTSEAEHTVTNSGTDSEPREVPSDHGGSASQDSDKTEEDSSVGSSDDNDEWSNTLVENLLSKPTAAAVFCRKLVTSVWQKDKLRLRLHQLSPVHQQKVAEKLSALLVEVVQKEELAHPTKKKVNHSRQQGLTDKRLYSDPLGYIFCAANVITAWHVLYTSDKRGYDVFKTPSALHALSVAADTQRMAFAIARRSSLVKVLDSLLVDSTPQPELTAALRIFLSLCSRPNVLETLGPELDNLVSYCSTVLSDLSADSNRRAAVLCIVRALASHQSCLQRLYVRDGIQIGILLHGYESETTPPCVRTLAEETRGLLRRFPLSCLSHGSELDCNVPMKCETVTQRLGPCLEVTLSHLGLGVVEGKSSIALLLKTPLFSTAMVDSLKRSHFLQFRFQEFFTKEKKRSPPPSSSAPKVLGWTVVWILDGKPVAANRAVCGEDDTMVSNCRLPVTLASHEGLEEHHNAFVETLRDDGWTASQVFHANPSQGLSLILLATTPARRESVRLKLFHVEML